MDAAVNLPGAARSGPDPEGAAYCLFAEPWWLDAVAPGDWGDILLHEGGDLRARLPFTLKRRLGVDYCLNRVRHRCRDRCVRAGLG